MKRTPLSEDEDYTVFEVPLDDVSVARLMAIAENHKMDPRMFLALICRDVLEDDELAHGDTIDIDPKAGKYAH
jgi:hypothetical protein